MFTMSRRLGTTQRIAQLPHRREFFEEYNSMSFLTNHLEPTKNMPTLTLEIVRKLLHDFSITANEFDAIDDPAAEALAKHQGDIYLDGLTSLSAEAAQALAKHEGELSLNGLTSLSAEAAQALAKCGGGLPRNMAILSEAAAQVLAKHDAAAAFADITDLNIDEFLDQGRSQRDKVRAKSKKYVRGELVKKHFPGEQVKQAGSKAPIEKEYLFVTSMRWAKDPAEQYGFNSYGGFVVFDPASKKLKILMNIRSLDHPEQ